MAASLIAQDNTNSLPAIPAPVSTPAAETAPAATPAPETAAPNTVATPPKHTVKKHRPVHRKPAAPEPAVTLAPGQAEVNVSELTVRGQAGLKGETITHLHKGDTVTVLDQINLSKHEADEPSQWAKISYPTNVHVWVDSKYVDENSLVTSRKLNLRAGPGENYSVVGTVQHGTSVTQIQTKGTWMQIQPSTNAFAFVAAKFLTQTPAMMQPTTPTTPPEMPENPPQTTQVPEQPPLNMTPQAPPPPTPTVRIVSHEGIVGTVGSLVAPTDYKLYDQSTKADIDFLYPISKDLDLGRLVDADVIVTGEEGVDQRWPNTPIMAIQSIQVVHTNVIKRLDLTPPRQRH